MSTCEVTGVFLYQECHLCKHKLTLCLISSPKSELHLALISMPAVPTQSPEQWVGVTMYTCRCMDLLLSTVPKTAVVITRALVLLRFFALGGIKRLELRVSDWPWLSSFFFTSDHPAPLRTWPKQKQTKVVHWTPDSPLPWPRPPDSSRTHSTSFL